MIVTTFVQVALVSTSATIALVLLIAWREFGRPRHVFTWATAFALSALMWAVALVPPMFPHQQGAATILAYALAGCASVLTMVGFRQRAGMPVGGRRLTLALIAYLVLTTILVVSGASDRAQLLPINLLNLVTFSLAARTLQGRRKGERAAERVGESGLLLLALLSFAVAMGLGATLLGFGRLDVAALKNLTLLVLPGVTGGIGLFTIILLAADLADQARRLAATDMLTGLLNRRGFEESAVALIDSARRNRRAITLAIMDLDRFKQVNDRFGHPAGDRVLCMVADILGGRLSRRDVLARIGGEEFAVILVDADIVTGALTIEHMRRDIAALECGLPRSHRVTASFGAAALHDEDADLGAVMRRADGALYQSKAEGRDRLTVA